MTTPFAIYKGSKPHDGFIDAIAQDSFFAIVELEESEVEQVQGLLHTLAHQVTSQNTSTLSQLETHVLAWIREHNLPMSTSFACVYIVDSKALVKTTGGGEIFIKRGREFAKLIWGNNGASGIIEYGDYLIVTISRFAQKLTLEKLKYNRDPLALVEEITPQLKSSDDTGVAAVFVKIVEAEPKALAVTSSQPSETLPQQKVPMYATPSAQTPPKRSFSLGFITRPFTSVYDKIQQKSQEYGRKKNADIRCSIHTICHIFVECGIE